MGWRIEKVAIVMVVWAIQFGLPMFCEGRRELDAQLDLSPEDDALRLPRGQNRHDEKLLSPTFIEVNDMLNKSSPQDWLTNRSLANLGNSMCCCVKVKRPTGKDQFTVVEKCYVCAALYKQLEILLQTVTLTTEESKAWKAGPKVISKEPLIVDLVEVKEKVKGATWKEKFAKVGNGYGKTSSEVLNLVIGGMSTADWDIEENVAGARCTGLYTGFPRPVVQPGKLAPLLGSGTSKCPSKPCVCPAYAIVNQTMLLASPSAVVPIKTLTEAKNFRWCIEGDLAEDCKNMGAAALPTNNCFQMTEKRIQIMGDSVFKPLCNQGIVLGKYQSLPGLPQVEGRYLVALVPYQPSFAIAGCRAPEDEENPWSDPLIDEPTDYLE